LYLNTKGKTMFKYLINNMRRGFATNSSSSHSLVYFKNEVAGGPAPVAGSVRDWGENEYGWGDFTLSSVAEKLVYALVSAVGQSGWWETDEVTIEQEVDKAYEQYGPLFPEFNRDDFKAAMEGYVDHQSIGDIEQLATLARDPHVVIYGGNDNDGTTSLDTLHWAGDNAVWGASTNSPNWRQTPEENAIEWKEAEQWRW
jgi:hypothetical protein